MYLYQPSTHKDDLNSDYAVIVDGNIDILYKLLCQSNLKVDDIDTTLIFLLDCSAASITNRTPDPVK